jgi:hypothetical protein
VVIRRQAGISLGYQHTFVIAYHLHEYYGMQFRGYCEEFLAYSLTY